MLGVLLKEARIQQNKTLRDLSLDTGIGFSLLSKYENGKIIPPHAKLQLIADALNISMDSLENPIPASQQPSYSDRLKYSALGRAVLLRIIAKSHGRCELCNAYFPDSDAFLELEHIVPVKDGGTNDITNLVAICPNCHKRYLLYKSPQDFEVIKQAAAAHNETEMQQNR